MSDRHDSPRFPFPGESQGLKYADILAEAILNMDKAVTVTEFFRAMGEIHRLATEIRMRG